MSHFVFWMFTNFCPQRCFSSRIHSVQKNQSKASLNPFIHKKTTGDLLGVSQILLAYANLRMSLHPLLPSGCDSHEAMQFHMNESTFSLIPGRQIHIVSSSVGREVPHTLYLKRAVAGGQTACFQSSPVKITLLCTYIYVHFEHCPIIVIGKKCPVF